MTAMPRATRMCLAIAWGFSWGGTEKLWVMFVPWICERPGALLLHIGLPVGGAGWMKLKETLRWCRRPPSSPPPEWESIGYNLDPSVRNFQKVSHIIFHDTLTRNHVWRDAAIHFPCREGIHRDGGWFAMLLGRLWQSDHESIMA